MSIHPILEPLRGQLIVSVQAERHEPLGPATHLIALAESVLSGGAAGLRLADLDVIRALRNAHPALPIIGLTKPDPLPADPAQGVYITPTLADVQALVEAGASIVAMDATLRPRPAESLEGVVDWVQQQCPQVALMADIDSLEAAWQADALGFDCIGTTLSGYTTATLSRYHPDEPDWELLSSLSGHFPRRPIIAEGRIWTPDQARRALGQGVFSVVVGSAITRPHLLTRRFRDGLVSLKP